MPKTTKASLQKSPKQFDTFTPKKDTKINFINTLSPQSKGDGTVIHPGLDSTKSLRSPLHPERILFKTVTRKPHEEIIAYDSDGANEEEERKALEKLRASTSLQPTKLLSNYDCWTDDLSPEEWVARCKASPEGTHAKSLVYHDYQYVWRDVRVLDYDAKKKKFLIQLGQNGMMKYVGRLSLLFHNEDPEKFKQRLQEARERQEIAEDEMRFYHFVFLNLILLLASLLMIQRKRY